MAKRSQPDRAIFVEASTRAIIQQWTPPLIRHAEVLADSGNLRMAAELCDVMLADDQVQGALTTLVGALLGLPLSFEMSGSKRKSKRAIKALEAGEDWWKCFPENELIQFVTWGVMLGVALGEIEWIEDEETGRVPGRLKVWNPKALRWDGTTRQWMLKTGDAGKEIVITPGDGKWVLFTPKGSRRPWKNGAWRAVARWWLLKDYAISDWGKYSERHGTGTLVATTGTTTVPMGATNVSGAVGNSAEARRTLGQDLQGLAGNSAIALPPSWDLKLIESVANTSATFGAQISAADHGIVIAIHGTSLTNEEGGSYAKAMVLGGVHIQVIAGLAETLSTCLHDGHIVFWAEYNFGDRALAPWPLWDATPPADLKGQADALGSLGLALTALRALSDRVDVVTMLEEAGVPLLKEEDVPKPPPAPPAPPAPPPPPAEEPADEAQADGEVPEEDAKPAKKAIAAGRLTRAKAKPHVVGQIYADAVADEARDAGTNALTSDLSAVLKAIDGAKDYEALRDALKKAFRGMSPDKLATLTERALILADLGGRLSVFEANK